MKPKTKILILGATGMLGHCLYKALAKYERFYVQATVRKSPQPRHAFEDNLKEKIIAGVDANQINSIENVLTKTQWDIVINCIGIIKQLPEAKNSITSIFINSLLPHHIAQICQKTNSKMIHISTDCVFSGRRGNYTEEDISDAEDLYGRSKYLGEVEYENCITLRTSIIGHEQSTKYGLLEWFLSQKTTVNGFTKAIYSGFPTLELAKIIAEFIIPNANLSGLYHVSSNPITKYRLLKIIADVYKKEIKIEPDDAFKCDRSLDSTRFRQMTGYAPPSWPELVQLMYNDFNSQKHN